MVLLVNIRSRQIVLFCDFQLANLTAHLDKMAEDVEKVLPDKDYEGMAVVDFESWSPIYEQLWEEMEIYR